MSTVKKGLTRQKGFSIIEVLIAIVIFAIGMIAMAQLQGNLTRSSANANVRTVATNIAEETIETLRSFARMSTDPANIVPAYEDIITSSVVIPRGGIDYTVTTTVSNWYYDIISDSFMGASSYFDLSYAPVDLFSDYKQVVVNVAWDDTRPWLIDESQNFTTDTGITLSSVISSLTSGGNSQVSTQEEYVSYVPSINYTPGQRPDIIGLALGDSKFKESLTPEPDVWREYDLVETRFDVVTYSQSDGGELFLRREEFMSLTCECKLFGPPGDAINAGRRPTIWAGDEYGEALFVDKPYGTSYLNPLQQSQFCNNCCQDHHDGGGTHEDDAEFATTRYDPFPNVSREYWESGTFAGDHKHYHPDADGLLVAAANEGDLYMESCALVRKDGYWRVMQDFNQEGVNAFPQDFLDDTGEVDVYSDYVIGAVGDYTAALSAGYESSPPLLVPPATGDADADLWSDHTTVPLAITQDGLTYLSSTQQLRNRGIYIGYISNDLRYVMDCLEAGGSIDSCESGDVKLDKTGSTNVLELLPFFDVQLTKLSRWNEVPINNPVDTTNETILTGNLHSRGVASQGDAGRQGLSTVLAKGHPGNMGLNDSDPVEPNLVTTSADITVESLSGDAPFAPELTIVNGTITSAVRKALASDVTITSTDAQCDRTPLGFMCAITGGAPTITIAGYGAATKTGVTDRTVCSSGLTKINEAYSDVNPWVVFSLLGAVEDILYNINIALAGSC